jgi:hypothetical protein|tara:strand:+ start:799 stop:1146 length:348 start_codon:yes stop_codon:yes gene_type:complete
MAYEVATVKIENPDNADDYIVIAKSAFDPSQGHRMYREPLVSEPPQAPVEPPSSAGGYRVDLVETGLHISVARLGPWLAEQTSIEMLVRMMDQDKRASAKALVSSRINALKKAAQ